MVEQVAVGTAFKRGWQFALASAASFWLVVPQGFNVYASLLGTPTVLTPPLPLLILLFALSLLTLILGFFRSALAEREVRKTTAAIVVTLVGVAILFVSSFLALGIIFGSGI